MTTTGRTVNLRTGESEGSDSESSDSDDSDDHEDLYDAEHYYSEG